jgi:hypothetical protein
MFARECRATALVTFLSSFPVSAQDRLDFFADSTPARITAVHDDTAPGQETNPFIPDRALGSSIDVLPDGDVYEVYTGQIL